MNRPTQGRHQGYTASPPVRGPGPPWGLQGGPEGPGLCVNVGLGAPTLDSSEGPRAAGDGPGYNYLKTKIKKINC